MSYNIEVEGGKSVRLKTAGKYCDRDIVVTAKGGSTGGGKLAQIVGKTITEVTAEDLDGVTKIGEYAFYRCNNLTRVDIPDNVTQFDASSFREAGIETILIPKSVQKIMGSAFQECKLLTAARFAEGTQIDTFFGSTFFRCYKLTDIEIPETVKSIYSQCFYECKALANIIIPKDVSDIGGSAFYNCTSLATVSVKATTPPTLGTNVFKGCTVLEKIIVPTGTKSAYSSATNWSAFADIIFEEGEV